MYTENTNHVYILLNENGDVDMKLNYKHLSITVIVLIGIVCCMIYGYHFIVRYITLQNLKMSLDQESIVLTEHEQGNLNINLSNKSFESHVQWTSTNDEIVKVDNRGHYEALKEGEASIISSIKGTKTQAECKVSVNKDMKIESMLVKGAPTGKIYPGTTYHLEIETVPQIDPDKKILFHSSDESVATIDDEGHLKILKEGKATISIGIQNTDYEETIELNVEEKKVGLQSLSLNEGSQLNIETGSTYQLQTIVQPSQTKVSLTYISDNPTVVEVMSDGLLKANRPGTATIHCQDRDSHKETSIKVVVKCDNGLVDDNLLKTSGIDSCRKLMIVAHPDDETLWGGGHLLEGGWYVVCLTNGYNEQRSKELKDALSMSQSQYIILNYPDLNQSKKKDDWSTVSRGIQKDVLKLLNYKSWDKIVTHNPDGEYGHVHHKKTDAIVTRVAKNTQVFDKLYYFGKFYSQDGKFYNKPILPEGLVPTYSGSLLEKKNHMIEAFTSQKSAIDKYWT